MATAVASDYAALLENALDAVFLTRPEGAILYANPAACRMFGYSNAEFCALGRSAVVDPGDSRLAAALEERRRTGRFAGTLTMVRKDGSRFTAELSSALFTDHGGEMRSSILVRDVSGRERMVAELQDALARANKLGGLLPICAACKKIRNDAGYWQEVEEYIQEHSEADFSHGICPDCIRRLYPEE